jgi:hypothetical protein
MVDLPFRNEEATPVLVAHQSFKKTFGGHWNVPDGPRLKLMGAIKNS